MAISEDERKTIESLLRERIGSGLIDIIPEGTWNQILDEEMVEFMRVTAPKIIQNELDKKLREDVRSLLASHDNIGEWDNQVNAITNNMVKEVIIQAAPDIMGAMLAPMMSGVIQDMRNRLGNNY